VFQAVECNGPASLNPVAILFLAWGKYMKRYVRPLVVVLLVVLVSGAVQPVLALVPLRTLSVRLGDLGSRLRGRAAHRVPLHATVAEGAPAKAANG